ncbi:hypothetical protein PIB30_046027 [Stylosanthes scabra]|uniref:Uncharacterized protein n=1 Tax=Stylosanthes scabra TaxID=79078 RepID=A0ABU6YI49_9FABA|nr:hypothetical protein [Stylosanthes scabra]
MAMGQDLFGAPSFMRMVDLEAMNGSEFREHTNHGFAAEDGEFYIGMEFRSRKLAIAAIRSYTYRKGSITWSLNMSLQHSMLSARGLKMDVTGLSVLV